MGHTGDRAKFSPETDTRQLRCRICGFPRRVKRTSPLQTQDARDKTDGPLDPVPELSFSSQEEKGQLQINL